jgi:hypothetical protein
MFVCVMHAGIIGLKFGRFWFSSRINFVGYRLERASGANGSWASSIAEWRALYDFCIVWLRQGKSGS